ncbi:MAG: hypothetical protein LBT97_03085 [Planctomycetota bacterium]|nr:hypothetical protein [Planctomycetota bacterium]
MSYDVCYEVWRGTEHSVDVAVGIAVDADVSIAVRSAIPRHNGLSGDAVLHEIAGAVIRSTEGITA